MDQALRKVGVFTHVSKRCTRFCYDPIMSIEDQLSGEPEDRLPDPEIRDRLLIDSVARHFKQIFGPVERVFEDTTSSFAPIDILRMPLDSEGLFRTYVTAGMACRPMNVPSEVPDPEEYRYAELVLHVPAQWPVDWAELQRPENWWPLEILQGMARLPHERESWVWGGHTLNQKTPYGEDTRLCTALICPSYMLPEDAETLTMADGRNIVFLTMAFIYQEEFEFCLANYSDAFLDRVADSGMTPDEFFILDKNRPNVCA